MTIRVLEPHRLDFHPSAPELPDAPGPWRAAWTVSLAAAGGTRIQMRGDALFLVNAPDGIVALTPDPPGNERTLAGEKLHAYPAVEDTVVLVAEQGTVYRWAPGTHPQRVWDTRLPYTQVSVEGLQGGSLTVYSPGLLQLVDAAAGKVLWQRKGDVGQPLPHGDALYAKLPDKDGGDLICLGVSDGALRWQRRGAAHPAGLLFAALDGHVWVAVRDEIRAFDADVGQEAARVRVASMPVLSGVADAQGRMHVCNGQRYAVLDLRALGREASNVSVRLAAGEEGHISVTSGRGMLVADGRLLFADRFGAVYAARAGDAVAQRLRAPGDAHLLGWGVAHGQLYVLTRDGRLSALRPA